MAAEPAAAGGARPAQRFRSLDACRGFCAVIVVLFHLSAATHFHDWPIVRNGYVAVDFFFVLSGFVIAGAYHDRFATPGDWTRFAVRRFGRLYPLHLAALMVFIGIECANLADEAPAFQGAFGLAALGQHLALVQGFSAAALTWNYPAWSISIELWVNLAFAAYVLALGRRAVFASAAIIFITALFVIFPKSLALKVDAVTLRQWVNVAQSVFGFILGTWVYLAYQGLRRQSWRPGPWVGALAAGVIVFVFADRAHFHALLAPILFAGVVLILAYDTGPVARLLHHPALQRLGTISYSVYLTHALYMIGFDAVIVAVAEHLDRPATAVAHGNELLVLGGPWVMDAAGLACVACVIAGSNLTYRWIEEPARAYFNRVSAPRG